MGPELWAYPVAQVHDPVGEVAVVRGQPAEQVELELVRRLTTPGSEDLERQVMHLRYRVRGRTV